MQAVASLGRAGRGSARLAGTLADRHCRAAAGRRAGRPAGAGRLPQVGQLEESCRLKASRFADHTLRALLLILCLYSWVALQRTVQERQMVKLLGMTAIKWHSTSHQQYVDLRAYCEQCGSGNHSRAAQPGGNSRSRDASGGAAQLPGRLLPGGLRPVAGAGAAVAAAGAGAGRGSSRGGIRKTSGNPYDDAMRRHVLPVAVSACETAGSC